MSTPSFDSNFDQAMEIVVRAFESGGVAVLALGSVLALVGAGSRRRRLGGQASYELARRNVGQAILLGLEFLIIADIVLTITVDPSLASAGALGLIVVVRTFLSFSLDVELNGRLPWREARDTDPARSGGEGPPG